MKHRGKVLIIEDNPLWAKRLRRYLEKSDFSVTVASNKNKAIEFLKKQNFHFITVDLQLDEATQNTDDFEGWEVLKIAKDSFTPKMVLTGFPDQNQKNQSKALTKIFGVTFVMTKQDFDKTDFLKTVIGTVEKMNLRL